MSKTMFHKQGEVGPSGVPLASSMGSSRTSSRVMEHRRTEAYPVSGVITSDLPSKVTIKDRNRIRDVDCAKNESEGIIETVTCPEREKAVLINRGR